MVFDHRLPDRARRRVFLGMQPDRAFRGRKLFLVVLRYLAFDFVNDPGRFRGSTLYQKPPRALGYMAPHQQNSQSDRGSDAESETPAQIHREKTFFQDQQGGS
jgi:hypothetical protein